MSSKRQESRERLDRVYQELLERFIPGDERLPVKDGKFWEWEDMADEFSREMTGAFLEELAKLSAVADLARPGPCPFCGSVNTKWLEAAGQQERRSKHGPVVLPRQVARCRPCGRSFSPSGAAMGSGHAGVSDATGGGAGVPGSRQSAL